MSSPTSTAAGCDALLVTDLTNIRWLTGFTGSAGRVLLRPGALTLLTDGRYAGQARRQLPRRAWQATWSRGGTREAQRASLVDLVSGHRPARPGGGLGDVGGPARLRRRLRRRHRAGGDHRSGRGATVG